MAVSKETINNFVEDLRKKANLNPPLSIEDLSNLIENLGGRIEYAVFDFDTDGKIEKNQKNGFTITINKSIENSKRRKFTIAHELGHLFIHMHFLNAKTWKHEKKFIDSTFYRKGYSQEEYEANEFAAALLMPRQEFLNKVEEYSENGLCDISKLSNEFDVSEEAATNRGRWLGVFSWD